MERVVQIFSSHAEAAAATREYYRKLTPTQRLDILLELLQQMRPDDETAERLAPVCRIVEFPRR